MGTYLEGTLCWGIKLGELADDYFDDPECYVDSDMDVVRFGNAMTGNTVQVLTFKQSCRSHSYLKAIVMPLEPGDEDKARLFDMADKLSRRPNTEEVKLYLGSYLS